ncbi:MAG TPA: cystathionine beta-lyase, partial [Firmicutes bacterium]|nr:cystathionine beta-lyase [Candidatus Fermentithermobacillaceae bacterium]
RLCGTREGIIPSEELRRKFNEARGRLMGSPGLLGLVAMEAAFKYGDEWLEQVLGYIKGNIDYAMAYFRSKVPEIKPMNPEATYLIWLDCRGLGLKPEELRSFFIEEARVGLNDGTAFGPEGEGYMRLNVGCPRSILEEGLTRIESAVRVRRKA